MGKIRAAMIKGLARDFVNKYPDKFTASFEENKQLLKELGVFPSKRVRNQVAGYIIRIVKRMKKDNA